MVEPNVDDRRPRLTAVFFDLDCTLLDRDCMIETYARMLTDHPPGPRTNDWSTSIRPLADLIKSTDCKGCAPRESVFQSIRDGVVWGDKAPTLEMLASHWRMHFPQCAVAQVGAIDLIRRLRCSGVKVGLISNGNGELQRGKLRAAGLEHEFEQILISGEIGLRKPDPAIFRIAMENLAVSASNAVMVGDHPEADIGGARSCGLHTIWLAGSHPWPTQLSTPTHTAERFSQLPNILEGLLGVSLSSIHGYNPVT